METNKNTESGSDESPENIFALSLPKGEESFPVLKAFQEFLDAERERARRRQMILTLSFMSAIVVLVVLFSVLGAILFNGMARRNDIKQDKLFEILLTERQASTSVPVPASTLLRQDPVVDEVMELVKQLRAETEALKAAVQRPVEPQPACEGEAVPNLASAASISVAVEEKPEPLPKRTGVFSSPKRKPEQTTSHAEADVAPSGPVSENKEVIERAEPEKKNRAGRYGKE